MRRLTDRVAVIVDLFQQSVGNYVAVSAHEHEYLREEFAVVSAHAVSGQALVVAVNAGYEQAVEFVAFGRGQAAEECVGDIAGRIIGRRVLLRIGGSIRLL